MQGLGKKIQDIAESHSHLLYTAPYFPFKNVGEVPLKKTLPNESKHIVVHKMFSTFVDPNLTCPRYLDIVFEATLLGLKGIPLPNYIKVVFEGKAIFDFLSKIGNMKGRHVFSTVGSSVDPASQENS